MQWAIEDLKIHFGFCQVNSHPDIFPRFGFVLTLIFVSILLLFFLSYSFITSLPSIGSETSIPDLLSSSDEELADAERVLEKLNNSSSPLRQESMEAKAERDANEDDDSLDLGTGIM